ncbi:hypothetical protein MJH12_07455, partial [bacterium]|nr:hypothetical protein [bacterium]
NYDFVTKGTIDKSVNLTLKGRSIREALDIISDSTETEYRVDGTIITVFGDGVNPSFTKTYDVIKGNALTIGNVLEQLIGASLTTQTASGAKSEDSNASSAASADGKPRARIVADRLNSQIIITALPSQHRQVDKVWPDIDVGIKVRRYATKMFELKFLHPEVFIGSIRFLIPGIEESQIFQLSPKNASTSLSSSQKRIIIQETRENLEQITTLLNSIDVPPRQVVIDVKMVEFSLTGDQKFGVDWKSIFTNTGSALPVGEFFSPLSNSGAGRIKFGSLGPDHLQIVLDFIKTSSNAKVLSNPQVTALDGKTAKITVADKIPYRTSTISNGVIAQTVEFKDAGITLEVTPIIFKNEFVNLTILPAVTSQIGDFDGVPIISSKDLSTTLNVRNNHTVVMGGLISHEKSHEVKSIPFLGRLPGIGKLFQSNSNTNKSKELIFLITPRIYSEFSSHAHNKMKYKFKNNQTVKPGGYSFVDETTQKNQLEEFRKRSKL